MPTPVTQEPYDELVENLSYSYDAIFSREAVAEAVRSARELLEPRATVTTFLPVLVARQSREQLVAAATALGERGIPLTTPYPKPLSHSVVRAADVIVTMGCGDDCPIYPGKRDEDWDAAERAGQPLEVVRDIRDDIQGRVTTLLRDILDRHQETVHR